MPHVSTTSLKAKYQRDYKRTFTLSDGRLILTTPPYQSNREQRVNRLVWERIK